MLAYLKVLVNPDDEIALLRIIGTPPRGIGKTTIDRVRAYSASNRIGLYEGLKRAENIDSLSKGPKVKIAAFINMLEGFKKDIGGEVAPLAERVFDESGLAEYFRSGAGGENALENVRELINGAADYDREAEQQSLLDYLQQIALFSDVDAYDTGSGRVALMTLHAAKGLEFENVFIVGLEQGLLPHEKSETGEDDEELEEERRLFFVGITRAKTNLYVSHSRYRQVRGQLLRTIPSQFLYELGMEQDHLTQESVVSSYDSGFEARDVQCAFARGDVVRHATFGLGTVEEFTDMGENSIVVVRFDSGHTKSLMIKYARLSKCENYKRRPENG